MLTVDDNEFNLFTFAAILKLYDLKTDMAYNGKDAVEKFQARLKVNPYKVVFMDVDMPVMNGFDATIQINKEIQTYNLHRSFG